MSLHRRDYLLRQIEQLAEVLGAIVGLRVAGRYDEALQLVQQTTEGLLGPLASMVDRLDSASAARLLGGADRIGGYASLVAERAEVDEARGQGARAASGRRRALELYLEAVCAAPERSPMVDAAIEALRTKVDEAKLSPDHRRQLARIGRR